MKTEKEVKTGASYTRDDDGTFTLTLNGDPVFCVRKEQDAKQIVEYANRCAAVRKESEVNEAKTAEEAAIEYGESFKTGEWFERIRIDAFKTGADYAKSIASPITQQLQQWVSVNERLPENRQRVLCYSRSYMGQDSWEKYTDQDDKWFVKRYTHWQPLPEPPKI